VADLTAAAYRVIQSKKEIAVTDGYWDAMMSGDAWWWWIPPLLITMAFWGGLIVLGVWLVRRNRKNVPWSLEARQAGSPSQTPQEILAERLARGDIELDDYRRRLDALGPSTRG
jgi:putative membrane protein